MRSGVTICQLSSCACSFLIDSAILYQIRQVQYPEPHRVAFPLISYLLEFKVVAPVRETVSQTLASLLIHMPRRCLLHVHLILLQMIRQNFEEKELQADDDSNHIWEVRHAGLLGIKYEVAVRHDLFDPVDIKIESGESNFAGREVLCDVVDAAILG